MTEINWKKRRCALCLRCEPGVVGLLVCRLWSRQGERYTAVGYVCCSDFVTGCYIGRTAWFNLVGKMISAPRIRFWCPVEAACRGICRVLAVFDIVFFQCKLQAVEIVPALGFLRCFYIASVGWYGNRGHYRQYGHNNHDFDQGETFL